MFVSSRQRSESQTRRDGEEGFVRPLARLLQFVFLCVSRGETSNSAKGQFVIFHPNFRSAQCKRPPSSLHPLRTQGRQSSPEPGLDVATTTDAPIKQAA